MYTNAVHYLKKFVSFSFRRTIEYNNAMNDCLLTLFTGEDNSKRIKYDEVMRSLLEMDLEESKQILRQIARDKKERNMDFWEQLEEEEKTETDIEFEFNTENYGEVFAQPHCKMYEIPSEILLFKEDDDAPEKRKLSKIVYEKEFDSSEDSYNSNEFQKISEEQKEEINKDHEILTTYAVL
jgi:hypothetical protein